jgi:bifunctional NMN adenylyltransferase/nudix hydrolase
MKMVGVIVGRFQVPDLHEGHKYLLKSVLDNHDHAIIFIGDSESKLSPQNPLSFKHRAIMIENWIKSSGKYHVGKRIHIKRIPDVKSDDHWNDILNEEINRLINIYFTGRQPILYGGRDSFLKQYKGPYPICQLFKEYPHSGTEIRKQIIETPNHSVDFRKGIIYASSMKYPTVYSTVDVAILTPDGFLLLGKKKGEKEYRLIGGFVDPSDNSIESAAKREVLEESGLYSAFDYHYLGNFKVEDWRYKNSKDSVITHLYCAIHLTVLGCMATFPKPGDDIEEIRIFSLSEAYHKIIPEHIPLLHKVRNFMEKNNINTGFRDPSMIFLKHIFTREENAIHA